MNKREARAIALETSVRVIDAFSVNWIPRDIQDADDRREIAIALDQLTDELTKRAAKLRAASSSTRTKN